MLRRSFPLEKGKRQNDGDDASLKVVGFYSFLAKSIFFFKNALLAQRSEKLRPAKSALWFISKTGKQQTLGVDSKA